MKHPESPLCYNCSSEICASDKRCPACESPIFFDLVDQSVVEFMTEGTNPNMAPRSDNG
jgi:predicted amidophosphoribosyltransferase